MNFLFSMVRKGSDSSAQSGRKASGPQNRNAEKRIRVIVDSIGRSEDRG